MHSVPTRVGAPPFINGTAEDLSTMQESFLGPAESQETGITA